MHNLKIKTRGREKWNLKRQVLICEDRGEGVKVFGRLKPLLLEDWPPLYVLEQSSQLALIYALLA
eukprot:695586-Amphidinium_carterae.1